MEYHAQIFNGPRTFILEISLINDKKCMEKITIAYKIHL
jgi:hypothetical protein